MIKNSTNPWLLTLATILATTLGVVASAAEVVVPAKGWAALQHANVERADKNREILYEVVTATMYGKRVPNGAAVPKLLVLREKTASRCTDESCLYRYSAFELGTVKEVDGVRRYAGKPFELDAEFTKYQAAADYVVTEIALSEKRDTTSGRSSWTLQTKLEEGATVQFAGTALAARPNPGYTDPRSARNP